MSSPGPVTDHVRLALPGEARAIAEVQRRVWAATPVAAGAAALLDAVDVSTMTEVWERAISRPPEARFRVLVALADTRVVGYAVTTPAADPDAEQGADGAVEELAIDPLGRRRGHGSRLLNACADTLRADAFDRARCWVPTTDDELRGFLAGAGWVPDGASREIGTEDDSVRVKQIRLHVLLPD